jgi:hypothetical protein
MNSASGDNSSDHQDRIDDFLARHGGAGSAPMASGTRDAGLSGWSEVHAADGYRLLCEWSRMGTREELKFSEIAPGDRGGNLASGGA